MDICTSRSRIRTHDGMHDIEMSLTGDDNVRYL